MGWIGITFSFSLASFLAITIYSIGSLDLLLWGVSQESTHRTLVEIAKQLREVGIEWWMNGTMNYVTVTSARAWRELYFKLTLSSDRHSGNSCSWYARNWVRELWTTNLLQLHRDTYTRMLNQIQWFSSLLGWCKSRCLNIRKNFRFQEHMCSFQRTKRTHEYTIRVVLFTANWKWLQHSGFRYLHRFWAKPH